METLRRRVRLLPDLSAIRLFLEEPGTKKAITLPDSWPKKMQQAGAKLRGHGGIREIYYQGEMKRLVEANHTEVREERSFTLLEDVDCPAVLAEQCFVTSEEDVAQFGSETGCKKTARAYYEAICAYFDTEPLPEAFETRHNG